MPGVVSSSAPTRVPDGVIHTPRPLALAVVVSLRPEQWTKNLLVFAGLVFSGRLFDTSAVVAASSAFAIFCVLSGSVYLFNDVADRAADKIGRAHV